jgi:peptide/nickel transport system substrate-binding protein
VEPVGEDVVRITSMGPMVLLPSVVASPATSILSPAAYKGERVSPVGTGTGPFVITEAIPAQRLMLKRNDAYWAGKPALAGAEMRFILDANVRATQVRTHEADFARLVPPSTLRQLNATPGLVVVKLDTPRATELLLNNQKPPLDNVKIRQAIRAAIDAVGLNDAVYEGTVSPATGVFLASDPWASTAAKPVYDVERAKALLKEAGIEPGTIKLGLLAYSSKIELKDVAAVVQNQLGEIGIEVDIRLAEYNAIEPAMLAGNFDMAFMSRGYLTDGGEPGGFLNADYGCSGSFNMSHFCDPAIDAKIKESAETADAAKRHAIYRDIASQLQSRSVTVFLINETTFDAMSSKVRNYRPHPLNYYLLTPELTVQ